MAVIACLSGDRFSDDQTAAWLTQLPFAGVFGLSPAMIEVANLILRKSTHFVEYAVLALLTHRALGSGDGARRHLWAWAFAIAVGYAALDELHQATTATRSGAPHDVALDALGAAVALFGASRFARRCGRPSA